MRIPKFWTRASRDGFEAPGWSFTSLVEAKQVAEERLAILIDVLTGHGDRQGRYLYGDRPVREPVTEVIGSPDKPDALVTRNAYGALCLNTEDIVFVDVDIDESLFAKLLTAIRASDVAHPALDRIRKAHAQHPQWALRIYRTRAGFRIIAMHARMTPASPEAAELFEALGADPLYRKLCGMQQSFRARLTPKPWRINVRRLPAVFPWRDAGVERAVNAWVDEYDAARGGYAVCDLVETLGTPAADPVIDRIVKLHDDRVISAGKSLA